MIKQILISLWLLLAVFSLYAFWAGTRIMQNKHYNLIKYVGERMRNKKCVLLLILLLVRNDYKQIELKKNWNDSIDKR